MEKWLSFALYGNTPRYVRGAEAVADDYASVFPGWGCRMAVCDDVDSSVVRYLTERGVVITRFPEYPDSRGMMLRCLPVADVVAYRDVDAKLLARDFRTCELWLDGEAPFAVIHDHSGHRFPIGEGAWMSRETAEVSRRYREFLAALPSGTKIGYADNERWLSKSVWPEIRDRCVDFRLDDTNPHRAASAVRIEPRESPLDVIGDGYGIYPGESRNLR